MYQKSIVRKQLVLYVGILVATFSMLASVLSVVYTKRYLQETEKKLIKQGQQIAKEYTSAFFTGDVRNLRYELQVLEDYLDASVFFIDRDGVLVMGSSRINEDWIGQVLTNVDAVSGVLHGDVITVKGRINGLFDEPVLTVGYPFQAGGIAGIFMCTSMPQIERSMQGMYYAGVFSFMIALTLGMVLVYVSSKKISQPLLEMNRAAKIIADGNFEQRVEIVSQDEVGQLAESFNHMADSLFQHEHRRRDFIANVSHDLRSPLTSIQGFLNAMLDGTIPPEKQQHYLHIVLEETERLGKLTNDIVELSRAQNSKLTIEPVAFDLNQLIRESLERLELGFKEKNIRVRALYGGKETMVFADREKIQRVMQNLLDNAIKFSKEGGEIHVETTVRADKKVLVLVRDFGRGIDPEDQKYVFDRFYKVDPSRGQDKKGSGLGLSIVREFMQAHGESIAVKSQPGEGTEFRFTLQGYYPELGRK